MADGEDGARATELKWRQTRMQCSTRACIEFMVARWPDTLE